MLDSCSTHTKWQVILVYGLATFWLLMDVFILDKLQATVSKPYMDEIFHIPQAQHYCHGNYTEWNKKITTLPGLYLFSTTALRTLSVPFDVQLCSVFGLRLTNVIMFCFNFIILFRIISQIHKKIGLDLKVAYAVALNLFPLNYFFQYLYYTDNGSTFFCLLAYYQHLRKRQNIAAIVGCVAVLYRQTNIVWIVFYMALTLLINARNLVDKAVKDGNPTRLSWLMRYMIETPEQRQQHNLLTAIQMDSKQIKVLLGNLFELLGSRTIWPYFVVICSFGLFVFANKGIVVGDRSNHEASLHVTQLFYFFTFSIICTAWHVVWRPIQNLMVLIKWLSKRLFVFTVSVIACMLIVQQFTYEHPFLLADNRHYTFYIWSRLYRRHAAIKYIMVPVYVLSIVLFYSLLSKAKKSYGWLVAFTICLSLCLIPQKLIEFRYYLIPFFIYRLNIKPQSLALVLGEILVFSVVNIVTMYLFLNRPFYWPDSSEPQRFMW